MTGGQDDPPPPDGEGPDEDANAPPAGNAESAASRLAKLRSQRPPQEAAAPPARKAPTPRRAEPADPAARPIAPQRAVVPVTPALPPPEAPPQATARATAEPARAKPRKGLLAPFGPRGEPLPATPDAAPPAAPARKRPPRPPRHMSSSRAAILSMTSQEEPLAEHSDARDPLGLAQNVLMRVAALVWLAGAVIVWGRTVGYLDGGPPLAWHRLDEAAWMPLLVIAVVAPVVAVGLWLVSSWGLVIWASAVVFGAAVAFSDLDRLPFGLLALLANAAVLLLVVAIAFVRAVQEHDED